MRKANLAEALTAAGGVSALAESLGLDHSTVSGWREIPAKHVGAVSRLTGLSLYQLRPDLFRLDGVERGSVVKAKRPLFPKALSLGLDPDAIAAKAVAEAVRTEKERRLIEEHREAFAAHNDWVEQNGAPLAKYRMF